MDHFQVQLRRKARRGHARAAGLVASLAALALVASACGSSSSDSSGGGGSSKSGNFVLGELDDLTGALSGDDTLIHQGLLAAVDGANARGGIDGHKVTLVTRDTQTSTSTIVPDYQYLVNQAHALAIMGMADSNIDVAVNPLADRDHVVTMAWTLPPSQLKPVMPYVFQFGLTTHAEAFGMVAYLKSLVSAGKLASGAPVAIYYIDAPAEVATTNETKALATAAGFHVVTVQSYPIDLVSAATQASRIVASGAKVILADATAPGETALVSQLKSSGFSTSVPIISASFTAGLSRQEAIGWATASSLTESKNADSGTSSSFTHMLSDEKSVKADPGQPNVSSGYLGGELVLQALQRCGYPCSSEKLKDQLNKTNTTLNGLAFGPVVENSQFHNGITTIASSIYDAKAKSTSFSTPVTVYSAPYTDPNPG